MILVGDIGGTGTRLGLYHPKDSPQEIQHSTHFASKDVDHLEHAIEQFLEQTGAHIEQAVLGVAGPVIDQSTTMTNLGWSFSSAGLRERFGLQSCTLINDMQAMAYAVPFLREDERVEAKAGNAADNGCVGVLALGTGLGTTLLVPTKEGYTAVASEGGHTSFAPQNEQQDALLAFARERYGHVSHERVCSGSLGLPTLMEFLLSSNPTPSWWTTCQTSGHAIAPAVVAAAYDEVPPCALARAALTMLASILGSRAGNLALTSMTTGGVYIGGGLAKRLATLLAGKDFASDTFERAFVDKGRYEEVLEQIPISIITHPNPGLLGAAAFASM